MPRRREVPKREVLPDPKFGSQDVSKFINVIMQSGKKAVAERIVYGAFEAIVVQGRQGSARSLLGRALQRQARWSK
jgi:small subunit ribosomal protein S7